MSILYWALGSSGVALLAVFTPFLLERYKAQRAERVAQAAHRRQLCTDLLTVLRDYYLMLEYLRSRHDNLKERWALGDPDIKRKLKAVQDVIARTSSELSLTPEGKKVQDAGVEYLRAGQDYLQAIAKPMLPLLTGHFSKANIQELDRLSAIVSAKHLILENTAARYVRGASGPAAWWQNWKERKQRKP